VASACCACCAAAGEEILNFGFGILNRRFASRMSVAESPVIHHQKFKIQNSKSARERAIAFPELMGFLRHERGVADPRISLLGLRTVQERMTGRRTY
jgi:hypothetical protein